jgi:hypothetical protein
MPYINDFLNIIIIWAARVIFPNNGLYRVIYDVKNIITNNILVGSFWFKIEYISNIFYKLAGQLYLDESFKLMVKIVCTSGSSQIKNICSWEYITVMI